MIFDNRDGFPISSAYGKTIYVVHGYGSTSLRKLKKLILKQEEGESSVEEIDESPEGIGSSIVDYCCSEIKMGLKRYYFATAYPDVPDTSAEVKPYLSLLPLGEIISASRKKIVVVVDLPSEDEIQESPFGIWSFFHKGDLMHVSVRSLRGVGTTRDALLEYGRTNLYQKVQTVIDPLAQIEEMIIERVRPVQPLSSSELLPLSDVEKRKMITMVVFLMLFVVLTMAGKTSLNFAQVTMKLMSVRNEYSSLQKELKEKESEELTLRNRVGHPEFVPIYLASRATMDLLQRIPPTCKIVGADSAYIKTPFPGCIKDIQAAGVPFLIDYENKMILIQK